jgi:hypothetical protein
LSVAVYEANLKIREDKYNLSRNRHRGAVFTLFPEQFHAKDRAGLDTRIRNIGWQMNGKIVVRKMGNIC